MDVDEAEPPSWVIYERGALVANVKEFRIVGLINADAELVNRTLIVMKSSHLSCFWTGTSNYFSDPNKR